MDIMTALLDQNSWEKEAVYIAKANGIISGVGENRFDAKSNATIQQALLMFKNGIEVSEIKLPETEVTVIKDASYDSINACVTRELDLTNYIGLDINNVYELLKPMYSEDVTLLQSPGVGYISIGGKFGQVVAMRCGEDNIIEEVWIGFNSYQSKPLDISMRKEMVNGYRVNMGVEALMNAMGIVRNDLVTSRRIQSTYDVIGYRNNSEMQNMNVELERRAAYREAHLKMIEKMSDEKKHLYAAAILDDHGNMIGSLLVVDFPTKDALDDYLKVEPYVTGKVWEKIEIKPCKVGPMFLK